MSDNVHFSRYERSTVSSDGVATPSSSHHATPGLSTCTRAVHPPLPSQTVPYVCSVQLHQEGEEPNQGEKKNG